MLSCAAYLQIELFSFYVIQVISFNKWGCTIKSLEDSRPNVNNNIMMV